MYDKTGKERSARAPPAEEITLVLQGLATVIEQQKALGKYPADWKPMFSLDNASIHKTAARGWKDPRAEIEFVPAYSPDLHQVIEHAHANCVRHWRAKLMQYAQTGYEYPSIEAMSQDVLFSFIAANPASSIAANVKKLREHTYPAVIAAKGGDVSAGLR